MRFRFSPRRHGVFLVYWLVILSLGGYLAWDYATDFSEQLHPLLRSTIASGLQSASRINEGQWMDIQKQTDAYPCAWNNSQRRRAQFAIELIHTCQDSIRLRRIQCASGRRIGSVQIEQLALQIEQAGDTLRAGLPPDSLAGARLRQLIDEPIQALRSPEGYAFFCHATPEQVDLHLGDLAWKLELALYPLLCGTAEGLLRDEIRMEELMPCLALKDCPEAGKPFTGEIFLSAYSAHTENLECSIGRQNLPFQAGLAEYETVFPRPGDYTRRVEIATHNPLTGEIKTVMKEFSIPVLEP